MAILAQGTCYASLALTPQPVKPEVMERESPKGRLPSRDGVLIQGFHCT